MAEKCYDDCHYYILGIQANMKHNMFNCLITTFGSLLAMEQYLGPLHTPGWTWPMNKESVRKIIDGAIEAKKKCIRDIKIIKDTIKESCPNCKTRRENSQNQDLPSPLQDRQILNNLLDFNFEELDLEFLLDDNALPDPTPNPNPNSQEI